VTENHDCWTPSAVADALNRTECVHQRLLERLQYIVDDYHRESVSLVGNSLPSFVTR